MVSIGFLLIVLVGAHAISIEYGQPKVVTKYGDVYGTIKKISIERERGCLKCPDKDVFFFQGIPYAKPPVGPLRFEKSESISYFGKINATEPKTGCVSFTGQPMDGQEDCLYMSIATPAFPPPSGKKFPVLVLIFGGAFVHGDSNQYQSDDAQYRFVTRGIIYVSFHYRVGPFGFYTSSDTSAPGNYGMWDQIQALKFIQEVIGDFGGDPNRVTIFGNSAGGSSVSWLTYSHHSKGLYKQALPYCGVSHSSTSRSNSTFTESKRIEDELGCASAKNKKECLKTKSTDEIWTVADVGFVTQLYIQRADTIFYSWWTPTFDNNLFPGSNWVEAEKTAPVVTILYGMNSNEEAGFVVDEKNPLRRSKYYPISQEDSMSFGEENLIEAMTYLLSSGNLYGSRSKEAIQKVIDYYLTQGNDNPVHKFFQAYVNFYSDLHFSVGAIREVKQKVKLGNSVYFYLNDYSVPNYPFSNPIVIGNGHCAENPYIYGNWSGLEPPTTYEAYDEYKKVQKEFVDMWVSFIKYGIPVHSGQALPRVTPHRVPYAHIQNITVMEENLWRENSAFWEIMAREYGFDFVTGLPDPS
ncbi:hypothetical protein FO519_009316 [Halicephalobus sp. NKZ332]|nr:hypothetical protein FO519_009316 [Halicephalobus sp. NKZ332]